MLGFGVYGSIDGKSFTGEKAEEHVLPQEMREDGKRGEASVDPSG